MSRSRMAVLLGMTMIFMTLSGCGSSGNPTASGRTGFEVAGSLPSGRTGTLLFQDASGEVAVPVGQEGRFAARLAGGRYRVMLQTGDGKLVLIKRSLAVEDNLTISMLEVDLVPIPSVVSVTVPVVSHDSAFVEWETDLESDGRVDFGQDSLYGFSTFTDTALERTHRIQLLGLRPSTPYHFRVVAGRHGLDEVQTFSKDFVFTTEPAPEAAQ